MSDTRAAEVARLVSRHIDGVITTADQEQLSRLIEQDSALADIYIAMMQLHGLLMWGANESPASTVSPADIAPDSTRPADSCSIPVDVPRRRQEQTTRRWRKNRWVAWLLVPGLMAAVGISLLPQRPPNVPIVTSESRENELLSTSPDADSSVGNDSSLIDNSQPDLPPLQFDSLQANAAESRNSATMSRDELRSIPDSRFTESFSDQDVVAAINDGIDFSLKENDVLPSPRANDGEWLRRAWLTVGGRIPTLKEMSAFHQQPESTRRRDLVEQLLESADRHRHLAETWTSLLIGRAERDRVNRPALLNFLTEAFATNRPWINVVGDLISAEGRNDENGAANFLLAHLDNQATPATAVTARLFLGEQLQCVQCHNHPFTTGIRQRDYWALNAFFQHTERRIAPVDSRQPPEMGSPMIPVSLVDRPQGGMTFFETPSGRQEAVVPEYDGRRIAVDSIRPRRAALAEFLRSDSQSRVARAMVNRVWSQFFRYGFTNPVDDMASHVTVTHREVLDLLTEAFVTSGYDLRRLQKWIALSDAWQRTSQAIDANREDAPESGGPPLFSRVYCQRMSPEQMYDSIRVAIRAVAGQPSPTVDDAEHRRQWVRQFVRPYNTDENDEASEFDGSMAQAMAMMNGPDVNEAVRLASEAVLELDRSTPPVDEVLDRVTLAVLTREPTSGESSVFRRHVKRISRSVGYRQALPQAVEDMMWAYLNSSEFLLIH